MLGLVADFSMFAAIPLSNRITPRFTLLLSGCMTSIAFLGVSFIKSPYVFLPTYTILAGTFNGILWMATLNNVLEFFPNKKGLCSGIVLSGVGIGTLIGNQIAKIAINPENLEAFDVPGAGKIFPEEVSKNFPFGLRMLAIFYCLVTIVGCILTFNYNGESQQTVQNKGEIIENEKENQKEFSKGKKNIKI